MSYSLQNSPCKFNNHQLMTLEKTPLNMWKKPIEECPEDITSEITYLLSSKVVVENNHLLVPPLIIFSKTLWLAIAADFLSIERENMTLADGAKAFQTARNQCKLPYARITSSRFKI